MISLVMVLLSSPYQDVKNLAESAIVLCPGPRRVRHHCLSLLNPFDGPVGIIAFAPNLIARA
jgi:hypothetical protein